MTLAERLDNFLKDYDFYDYQDNDGSVEKAEKILKESPETVISNLLDILEDADTRMLTKITGNEYGAIFHSNFVPNDMFNFYILRKRSYKDGTNQWNICCELKNNDQYMVIERIKGTREDAMRKLEEILKIK